MSAGKSVRLFMVDGTPGGLLTAEVMNWTGHVIAAPRSDLAALLKRPEAGRTGVYILLGDNPAMLGGTIAYIGEGDDVSVRLRHHARAESQGGKDFWDRAIVLTSKDANLTKAHARYLESRLIALAAAAGRSVLTNGTAPEPLPLPEADISDMEYFIGQAKIVLPALGVNLLRQAAPSAPAPGPAAPADTAGTTVSPVFELTVRKAGVVATAREIDGEFVVVAGSLARREFSRDSSGYEALHAELRETGQLRDHQDGLLVFSRDTVFKSPSAAAAVVTGRAANGRIAWKIAGTTETYADWQSRGIEDAVTGLAA